MHLSVHFFTQGYDFNIIIPATELQSSVPNELAFRDRHDPSGSSGVLWLLKKGHYHSAYVSTLVFVSRFILNFDQGR
jgi:hypothetical protein